MAAHRTFVVIRCKAVHHGHCLHQHRVGKSRHHDRKGANHVHFTGRLHHHALKPRHYLLRVTARLNGKHSRTVHVTFTIGRRA